MGAQTTGLRNGHEGPWRSKISHYSSGCKSHFFILKLPKELSRSVPASLNQTAKHCLKQSGQLCVCYKRYLEHCSLRLVEQWGLKEQIKIWNSHTTWRCVIILTQKMFIYGQANKTCCVTKPKITYLLDQHSQYEAYILLPWSHCSLWVSVGFLPLLNQCCW